MKSIGPIRSALFVPGNRPDRVDKAVDAGADAVIIDLEDAVPLSEKAHARSTVREKISEHRDKRIIVRVNALNSPFARDDLDEIVAEGLSCIMAPKVEDAAHIQEIVVLIEEKEKERGMEPGSVAVLPLIESAKAVENIHRIISQNPFPERIFTVAFGAADFTLDMGVRMTIGGEELQYPRARIAIACRAGGIASPLDTPFMIDLKDFKALETDAERAKQLGFQGKLCVHPAQVDICNRVFSPTNEEIANARKVVEAFHKARQGGTGAVQLDGRFIDLPIVSQARRTLELAAIMNRAERNRS